MKRYLGSVMALLAMGYAGTCAAAIPASLSDPANCVAYTAAPLNYVFCDDEPNTTVTATPDCRRIRRGRV